MIELHYAPTPNGHKIAIALEEMGLDYEVHRVNIGQGDQFKPEFLAFSPNNRIPAIIDRDGEGGESVGVFESGAILMYLSEKTGQLLPASGTARKAVIEWLMWQMGGIGPMLGQAHHFNFYAKEQVPYAMDRYSKESTGSMGFSTGALKGGISWQMTTPSPISRFSPGREPLNGRAWISTIIRMWCAGARPCLPARLCSAA